MSRNVALRMVALAPVVGALAACATAKPPVQIAAGPDYAPAQVVIDHAPLPLDPMPLPPNTQPGDCLARAPEWVRIDCGSAGSPTVIRREYVIESAPSYAYGGGSYGYDDRYSYGGSSYAGYGGYPVQYGGYRYAGRDAEGYLVWPGKTPR